MIRRFLNLFRLILIFLLIILLSVFVSSNAGFVELNLSPLGYVVEVRIFLLVLVSFTLGVATSKILTYLDRFFALIDLSDFLYRRKIKVLEKKITELKNNRVKYENNKLEIKNDSNKE